MFSVALIGTLIVVIVFALGGVIATGSKFFESIGRLVVIAIITLIANLVIVYLFLPPIVGPLAYAWVLWVIGIEAVILGFIGYNGSDSNKFYMGTAIAGGISIIVVMVVAFFIQAVTVWSNTKTLASYGNIVLSDQAYPDTDTAHMAIVPESVAEYSGGQVIAKGGSNFGSMYHASDYNLMSVDNHLYWIAPLIYNNIFANMQDFESPGLVIVDAEDPNAQPRLDTTHKLHYLPGAIFNQDLTRHLYLNGYSNYRLLDATLEVDDEWNPYYTVDLSTYATGIYGIKVHGALVVNSDTGEIKQYTLETMPKWIDRIIPGDAAEQYVRWWGLWHDASWINFSGRGREISADDSADIAYSRSDQSPVWQFVMTSGSQTDSSSTGIILYDTRTMKGTLYRITGLAVGSNVSHAILTNSKNIKNYELSQLILHNIYGNLTWVGAFISPLEGNDTQKATFQGIGMLNALTVQGADVQMAGSKQEVLRDYQRWLANHGSNSIDPTNVAVIKEIEGYVDRFASDIQNGNTVYYLTICPVKEDPCSQVEERIFYSSSILSQKLPLTQKGDHVVIRYEDVNNRVTAMSDFNNLDVTIPLVDPITGESIATPITVLPTATPTPQPTPTATSIPGFEVTPTP